MEIFTGEQWSQIGVKQRLLNLAPCALKFKELQANVVELNRPFLCGKL